MTFVNIENARSDDYRKKLELINNLGVDPFSREFIDDPRFDPKEVLHESSYWFVFKNQHSYAGVQHQFVFVSLQYAEDIWELSPEAQVDLFQLIKKVRDEHNIKGGGIVTRFGPGYKSGATVKHLHVQLIEPKDNHAVAAWFGLEKK